MLARERYRAAAHAMQSGVAMQMQWDPAETSNKHLRVGVNASMRDLASLVFLLVAKGIITQAEYETAIADGMEQEAADYKRRINEHYGTDGTIELG